MIDPPGDLTDARLAAWLATRAGELLLEIRASGITDAKELGREGDRRSNQLILDVLASCRPGDAVLSEEAVDDPVRLSASRVWIIDPLDGTREFAMGDRSDWAVHIALWQADGASGRLSDAAVSQPALGEVYATDEVTLTGGAAGGRARPLILVSDSRPPALAAPVADLIGAEVAPMGSAGAKAMAVLRGDADAYLHAGGQWEWDSAAPVGVLRAGGFHTSRIDGSPLEYNRSHPYLPDLLLCRAELAEPLLAAIATVAG